MFIHSLFLVAWFSKQAGIFESHCRRRRHCWIHTPPPGPGKEASQIPNPKFCGWQRAAWTLTSALLSVNFWLNLIPADILLLCKFLGFFFFFQRIWVTVLIRSLPVQTMTSVSGNAGLADTPLRATIQVRVHTSVSFLFICYCLRLVREKVTVSFVRSRQMFRWFHFDLCFSSPCVVLSAR